MSKINYIGNAKFMAYLRSDCKSYCIRPARLVKPFISSFILSLVIAFQLSANNAPTHVAITDIISKAEFFSYKNVADFIDHSPKVTIMVGAEREDISTYGKDVVKSLTGSDCDRDGKMDDNAICNAVYYKLWLAYAK